MKYKKQLKLLALISDNIDGTWKHYAKWNKTDREGQIVSDLTYMYNLKKPNS